MASVDELAALLGMGGSDNRKARFGKVEAKNGSRIKLAGGGEAVDFCKCSVGDAVVLIPVGGAYAAIASNGDSSVFDTVHVNGKLTTGGRIETTDDIDAHWITGQWLRTSGSMNLGRAPAKVAVMDDAGWLYYRTPAELRSDMGL